MNFDNSIAYILYKFYNQLGIHGAPAFVLDLFVPFLIENGKFFLVGKVWGKTYDTQVHESCCPHFEEAKP